MRWTVLGAGTAAPHPLRSPAGHLLQCHNTTLLIDMGPGTLWRAAAHGVPWTSLDAILLSHRHLDHSLDLPALLFASRLPGHGRARPLPVHFGPGMRAFVAGFEAALGRWMQPLGFHIDWHEHETDHLQIGDVQVALAPVAHDPTSLGMRFTGPAGEVIAYSGDSDVCDALVALCQDADLAVLECSTPDGEKLRGHLSPREVAQVATQARARRVALVHTYPSTDGLDLAAQVAQHGYHGPVTVTRDGERLHTRQEAPDEQEEEAPAAQAPAQGR
jgi:ribonuclease BN (tRNA processing enzyme)